jgi:uncharacterized protein
MIIKLEIKNCYSFNDAVEFNMLPSTLKRSDTHKIKLKNDLEVLKLAAIYGANASGKSNFVNAFYLLKQSIADGKLLDKSDRKYFKLGAENEHLPIELSIEFYSNQQHFFYAVDILNDSIVAEKLLLLETKKEDRILLERKTDVKTNNISISLYDTPTNDPLIMILSKNILKDDDLLFGAISKYSNGKYEIIEDAFFWFTTATIVINIETRVPFQEALFDPNRKLLDILSEQLCSYTTGIEEIKIVRIKIEDYFGKNEEKMVQEIIHELNNGKEIVPLQNHNDRLREPIVFVKEKDQVYAKFMMFKHYGEKSSSLFKFNEESDGTKRLIELIPFIYLLQKGFTIIIDEIERSLHPSLIKDMITNFSKSSDGMGQLIFTTHETHLLDQEIIRPDEIWLCEKDKFGATHMQPMSNYDVHSTKNIRNGYLQGRFGGIPFLTN